MKNLAIAFLLVLEIKQSLNPFIQIQCGGAACIVVLAACYNNYICLAVLLKNRYQTITCAVGRAGFSADVVLAIVGTFRVNELDVIFPRYAAACGESDLRLCDGNNFFYALILYCTFC